MARHALIPARSVVLTLSTPGPLGWLPCGGEAVFSSPLGVRVLQAEPRLPYFLAVLGGLTSCLLPGPRPPSHRWDNPCSSTASKEEWVPLASGPWKRRGLSVLLSVVARSWFSRVSLGRAWEWTSVGLSSGIFSASGITRSLGRVQPCPSSLPSCLRGQGQACWLTHPVP